MSGSNRGCSTELQDAAIQVAAAADRERQAAQAQLAALSLSDAAHTATARAGEITKRAEDLKTALKEAQGALRSQTAEANKEREQHTQVRARLGALTPEHATAVSQVARRNSPPNESRLTARAHG